MTLMQLSQIVTRGMQCIVKVLDSNDEIGDYVFMTKDQIAKKCKTREYEVVSIRRGTESEKPEYGKFATFVEVIETDKEPDAYVRPNLVDILKAFDPSINVDLATSNGEIYTSNYPGPLLNIIEGDETVGCMKTRASNGYFVRTTTSKSQYAALQAKKTKAEGKSTISDIDDEFDADVIHIEVDMPADPVVIDKTSDEQKDSKRLRYASEDMVSVELYTQKGIELYTRYPSLSDDKKKLINFSFSKDNGIYNLNMLFTACINQSIRIIDFCEIIDISASEYYMYLYRFFQLRGKVSEPTNQTLLESPSKHPEAVVEPSIILPTEMKLTKAEREARFNDAAKKYIAGIIDYDVALKQSTYSVSTFHKKINAYRKEHNIITAKQTDPKNEDSTSTTTIENKEAVSMPTTITKVDSSSNNTGKNAITNPVSPAKSEKKIPVPPLKQGNISKPNRSVPNHNTSAKKITSSTLFGRCSDFTNCISSINNVINMYNGILLDREIINLMRKHSMVGVVYANLIEKQNGGKVSTLSSAEVSKACSLDLGTMLLNGEAIFDINTRQYAMNGIAELLAMNLPDINVHVDENRKMVIRMKTDPDPANTPDNDTEEWNMIMEFVKTRCRSMEGAAVTDKEAYTKYQQFCDGKQYASKLIKLKDFITVFSDIATAVYKDVHHTSISDYGKGNTGYENMIILR